MEDCSWAEYTQTKWIMTRINWVWQQIMRIYSNKLVRWKKSFKKKIKIKTVRGGFFFHILYKKRWGTKKKLQAGFM